MHLEAMKIPMSDKSTKKQGQPNQIELENLQEEVNAEASPLFDFLVKYAKVILGAVAAILLIVAGYTAFKGWTNYSKNQASEELAQVLTLSGEAKIEALNKFAANAPDHIKGGALFELAGALMDTKRFDDAAEAWKELELLNSDDSMGLLASMGLARCLLLADKADEAMAKAQEVVAASPEALLPPANRLLAACAEAAGNKTVAITALNALLESGRAVDAPLLSYRIRTLEAK